MKKVESANSRLHGICVVGGRPKDSGDLGNRFPGTPRQASAGIGTGMQCATHFSHKTNQKLHGYGKCHCAILVNLTDVIITMMKHSRRESVAKNLHSHGLFRLGGGFGVKTSTAIESTNWIIQTARRRARGFRNFEKIKSIS